MKICVIENDLITVWVDPRRKLIHHVMKQYCYGAHFREGLLRGVEAMQEHGATKWLSDNRVSGAVPPDDLEWSMTHWFPMAKAAGWRHWGIVKPAKLLGELTMERLIARYAELGINARMFADPDEATRWLETQ